MFTHYTCLLLYNILLYILIFVNRLSNQDRFIKLKWTIFCVLQITQQSLHRYLLFQTNEFSSVGWINDISILHLRNSLILTNLANLLPNKMFKTYIMWNKKFNLFYFLRYFLVVFHKFFQKKIALGRLNVNSRFICRTQGSNNSPHISFTHKPSIIRYLFSARIFSEFNRYS